MTELKKSNSDIFVIETFCDFLLMKTQKRKLWKKTQNVIKIYKPNSKPQIVTIIKILNYDKTEELKLWQNSITQTNLTQKLKSEQNLKKSNQDKTQKLKLWQNSKTKNVTKLKTSNVDKNKKNQIWPNSKNFIVTKIKLWQNLKLKLGYN